MDFILFPASYKKALIEKKKNTTIRLGNEMGKYKKGEVYQAASYAGNRWGIKIKVKKVIQTKVKKLLDFSIPRQTIKALLRKRRIGPGSKVDFVMFEII